ncbi:MAG: CHAT domain-containing tetratricopeptide repeat protein [Candidatus Krumholzibacteriota bacterium]
MPKRCSPARIWVLIIAATGVLIATAAWADSPQSRDQILAHIDTLHSTRQVDAAASYIEPRLARARAAEDSAFTLPLVSKLGRLWAAFGQPKKGEPLLREAARLAEALEDSLRWCDSLRWLGYAVEQQGRSTEAELIYRRQLAIALARKDHRHEAWARVGLAYRDGQEGWYTAAADEYRLAVRLFQDLADTAAVVWTLNGLGAVLQLDGSFPEAAATYKEVADLAGRIGYKAVEALAQNNTGALEFSLGDPGVALNHFRRARELQLQISQRQDAVSSGTNEANCLMHLGRLDEAAALLTQLLQECEAGSFLDREAFVLRVLADVRRLQGRRHEAVAIHRRILRRDDASLDIQNRIESMIGYAGTLAEMDSSAVALEALLDEEKRSQGRLHGAGRIKFELSLGDRLLETGQPEQALARYQYAIDAATTAGLQGHRMMALAGAAGAERALGKPKEALTHLQAAAIAWADTRNAPTDPEWREQRGTAGRVVYTQLAALTLAVGGPDSAAAAFDAIQVFKARTLAERIGIWDRATDRPATTLGSMQTEILEDGELFLDTYVGPAESILFAVTKTECRVVVLPDGKTLAKRLRFFHEMLATAPPPDRSDRARKVVEAAGAQLGDDIFGPIAHLIAGSRRVIFAPDGPLNLAPLSFVAPGSNEETRPVWMRIPSAEILEYKRRGRTPANPRVRGILAAAGAETPAGKPLPGAVREVRHLAQKFHGVDLRVGGETGDRLVPKDLRRYDILHLATHARVDDQRPWSSEIILDVNDPGDRIQAGRIADQYLKARLAVLSACETGSGRILSGEGVLGLSSAFLIAGVRTVVASLWPVDDGATAALMKEFYAELSAGHDVATALARAQEAIREKPATAHPFYWAGFVVVGDGAVAVDLEVRDPRGTPGSFLAAAVVIVAIFIALRRRLRPAAEPPPD